MSFASILLLFFFFFFRKPFIYFIYFIYISYISYIPCILYVKSIEDRKTRDIRNLFESENGKEDYYKPVRVGNFYSNNYSNMKVMVIEMKHYQLKNNSINLDHT